MGTEGIKLRLPTLLCLSTRPFHAKGEGVSSRLSKLQKHVSPNNSNSEHSKTSADSEEVIVKQAQAANQALWKPLFPHKVMWAGCMLGHEKTSYLPRMLMASTLRPPMDCTPMMVCTHSYRMAFPAFRAPSVFVATCARMSLMASLAAASPAPRIRSSLSTCGGTYGVTGRTTLHRKQAEACYFTGS